MSLRAKAAPACMAPTSPRSSASEKGATVDRNIRVAAPPDWASLALTTCASLASSIPAASARTCPS